jgi:PAT family beta-lactamase induction signal transducer AmpG
MAGVMSSPLYISLGFSLPEIAAASKVFGFFSITAGVMLGGVVTTRYGIVRSLILCGILQSAGNLFFVLQAVGGHHIGYLALCVTAENLTGGMAGTALITYIAWPHRRGLIRGMVVREDGLGMVLRDDERRGTAGTSSFPLDRTA